MELTFQELLSGVNGTVVVDNDNKNFNKLSIDTRRIEKNNVYLAIKGANFNGNNYAIEALEKGANIAIVDEINGKIDDYKGLGIVIKVKDTKESLLSLAKFYREKLGLKVIGVTGSTGKTSTKDLLAAFLSGKYKVFKTKGNYNNDIGLPLMVLELDSNIDVAILEMGMNNLKEIHTLAKTATPNIGVITNIGLSHIENLKTQENILKAKMEITDFFTDESTLVLNGEDKFLKTVQKKSYEIIKTGLSEDKAPWAKDIKISDEETSFIGVYEGVEYPFTLPMVGAHNVLNGLLAMAVSLKLGVTYDEMVKGLQNLEATSMRLEVTKGEKGRIINDCYNASPDSMMAALDVLSGVSNRKVAILGTMKELGDESKKAHKEVGEYAKNKCDILLACGEFKNEFKLGYSLDNGYYFNTKEEMINSLKTIIREDDCILVKASRGEKFEEIINELKNIVV